MHGPRELDSYMSIKINLNPLITGGSQERKNRGGTENLYGIVGLGKAMEMAYEDLTSHQKHIQDLKSFHEG